MISDYSIIEFVSSKMCLSKLELLEIHLYKKKKIILGEGYLLLVTFPSGPG